MKLRSPERLFGLDEEIDRRLPRVRSLRLIRAERYGGWLKCIAIITKVCIVYKVVTKGPLVLLLLQV